MKNALRLQIRKIINEMFESTESEDIVKNQILLDYINNQNVTNLRYEKSFAGGKDVDDAELRQKFDSDEAEGEFDCYFEWSSNDASYEVMIGSRFLATITMSKGPEPNVGFRGDTKIDIHQLKLTNFFADTPDISSPSIELNNIYDDENINEELIKQVEEKFKKQLLAEL